MLTPSWIGLSLILVCTLSLVIWGAAVRKRKPVDGSTAASLSVLGHLNTYLLGVIWVLLLVAGIVLVSDAIYPLLKGALYRADGSNGIDIGDFLSILALLTGFPLALAGSIYAIYLAILGLRASTDQKRLAEQANTFSDPAHELSHRAYNAYRRFGFLVGALLASSRIERQSGDNAAYEGEGRLPVQAAPEIIGRLRELLFDEAFSLAALEAARCHGRREAGDGGNAAEHRLRSAFARLIGLLGSVHGRPLDVQTMPPLMAALSALGIQMQDGINAVVAETGDGSAGVLGSDEQRFLAYLASWMTRIGPLETGRDLGRIARASLEEDVFFSLDKRRSLDKLVASYIEMMLDDPSKLGYKTSQSLPVVPSIRIRAGLGDFDAVDLVRQTAVCTGGKLVERVAVHPFNGFAEDEQAAFHVLSCSMTGMESLVRRLPLRDGFRGVIVVDGIRAAAARTVESRIRQYEEAWAERQAERKPAIPTRVGVLVDTLKNLGPEDRIEQSAAFLQAYGEKARAARLLLIGIDYFEFRPAAPDEDILHMAHVFAQQDAAATNELERAKGAEAIEAD